MNFSDWTRNQLIDYGSVKCRNGLYECAYWVQLNDNYTVIFVNRTQSPFAWGAALGAQIAGRIEMTGVTVGLSEEECLEYIKLMTEGLKLPGELIERFYSLEMTFENIKKVLKTPNHGS